VTEKLEDKIKKLGNIIGDVLSMIEQEAINATIDPFIKRKIMELIDVYAKEFDEILKNIGWVCLRKLKNI
jgi:hypothetical protein